MELKIQKNNNDVQKNDNVREITLPLFHDCFYHALCPTFFGAYPNRFSVRQPFCRQKREITRPLSGSIISSLGGKWFF